jgi:hypothetical protein
VGLLVEVPVSALTWYGSGEKHGVSSRSEILDEARSTFWREVFGNFQADGQIGAPREQVRGQGVAQIVRAECCRRD